MMQTSVDAEEVAKFARQSGQWWQTDGAFRTLHDINPIRLDFIEQYVYLKDQRILDIGCGGGILCEGLAKRGGIVTGLDVEEDAIAVARAHAKDQSLTIDYLCQPVETLDSEAFPIITCLEMLEHVSNPQMILNEVSRLLMPGGYLFLSTINRNAIAYAKVILAAEYLLQLLPRQTHDYQKFIKPSELASMVRAVGLEVVNLQGLTYYPMTRTAALSGSLTDNYLLVARSTT